MPLVLSGTNGISTNGTNWAIQPDSSGRVRAPLQPSFNAWLNTVTTTVTATGIIPFNATRFNIGNHFSTATGRFTCPVAGVYVFGAHIGDDDGAEFVGKIATFYLNGAAYRDIVEGTTAQNSHFELHCTTLINCAAGDIIDVRSRGGSFTFNNGSDGPAFRNGFWGYLLG